MYDIANVATHPFGVELTLRSGRRVDLQTNRQRGVGASVRDSLAARVGLHLGRTRAANVPVGTLARAGRPAREWLASLEQLARTEDAGYRTQEMTTEQLWSMVEDTLTPATARAGAAALLRPMLDDAGRARLRAASVGAVSPGVRVALESAATAPDDATFAEALAECEDESAPAAKADEGAARETSLPRRSRLALALPHSFRDGRGSRSLIWRERPASVSSRMSARK